MASAEISLKEYKSKLSNNRLGLWLFLLSDAFVFVALIVTRFVLLGDSRPELSQGLGLAITALLLVSSFYMNRAETEMAHGNQKGFQKALLITFILGLVFLIGVVGLEWQIAKSHGLTPDAGQAGAIFYVMTGFHAFHVFTGIVFLFVVYRNGKRGVYTPERHWGVEAAAVYWHFVDVAWIFFYPVLYLMGSVIH